MNHEKNHDRSSITPSDLARQRGDGEVYVTFSEAQAAQELLKHAEEGG